MKRARRGPVPSMETSAAHVRPGTRGPEGAWRRGTGGRIGRFGKTGVCPATNEEASISARLLGLTAVITIGLAAPVLAQKWTGDAHYAQSLVQAQYTKSGVKTPEVVDTGRTFRAGGAVWRVYHVKYEGTGFRHVAVTKQRNGEYLAIEGLEAEKKWSHRHPHRPVKRCHEAAPRSPTDVRRDRRGFPCEGGTLRRGR